MSATTTTFYGVGAGTGKPMSFTIYNASSAADGSICPAKIIGVADSNSPLQLNLPETMIVNDVISGAATGKIRVESDGLLTQKTIDYAAQQATSAGRPPQGFKLAKSKTYRFLAEGALPA
jgi:hypothetical protein